MKKKAILHFERIVIVKTILNNVNLNYLSLNDLYHIQGYAKDLEVPLSEVDLDVYYNSESDKIWAIYKRWKSEIYIMFETMLDLLLDEEE